MDTSLYQASNDKYWLAAYLYYTEPWDHFLTEHVRPFAYKMRQIDGVENFFFIRYWERGPHIRLRFYGDKEALINNVKPAIDSYFNQFFKENPSERQLPDWAKNLNEDEKWFPNNSIQYITYEPETERYGGTHVLRVSEQHFEASSRAILEAIHHHSNWEYTSALGTAIQLHVSFAHALEMTIAESKAFFNYIFKGWLPRAYKGYSEQLHSEEQQKREKETITAFQNNLDQQKDMILPFCETIWEALNDDQEFEEDWMNQWVQDTRQLLREIKEAQAKQLLEVPDYSTLNDPFDKDKLERWYLYGSYIHMINNRLGIFNHDEGYLGYLLRAFFDTYASV